LSEDFYQEILMKRIVILLAAGLVFLALATLLKMGQHDPALEAQEAYRQGDYARALEKFQEAAQDSSDPARAAHNQAAALAKLRRYAEAEKYYQCEKEAGGDLRGARAAYDQGNCEVRQAWKKTPDGTEKLDPTLLAQAVEHYRACLEKETPGDKTLFANARHNLEIAKALLAEAGPPDEKPADSAKGQPNPAGATQAQNDPKKAGEEAGKSAPKEDLCPT
jgi:tetratricopeptide (TPR) repeat protein